MDTLTIALTWEGFCAILQRAFPVPSQLINLAKHTGSAYHIYSSTTRGKNNPQKFNQVDTSFQEILLLTSWSLIFKYI